MGFINYIRQLRMFLTKNNRLFTALFLAFITAFLHLAVAYFFLTPQFKLAATIHTFLISWLIFYCITLNQVHSKKPNYVIASFMVLTTIKMLISILLLFALKYLTTISPTIIILNFFAGFFIHLILQVNYSIKLLR